MLFKVIRLIKCLLKKYHTAGRVPKYNCNNIETKAKSVPLKHEYMTAHIPSLEHAFKEKVAG